MPDMRRAMVTGANGFIAGALSLRLLELGVQVRAVCRDPAKGRFLTGAEVVQGDIQDADTMRRYAQGCDVVFHVAALTSGPAAPQYRANVIGSEYVAEAAYAAGAARLVHVSSIAVYGPNLAGPVFESHPQQPSPRDYYQQSKKLGEETLWKIARRTGLPTTMIRPAMVYGPRSGFWSLTMYQLIQRLPFVPDFGEGTAHPIYIDDLVEMLIVAATHPDAVGEAFNASADPAVSWNTYLDYFARMVGRTKTLRVPAARLAPLARPVAELTRLSGDPLDLSGFMTLIGHTVVYRTDKARERLGWQQRVSLAEGMARTEPWLRSFDKLKA